MANLTRSLRMILVFAALAISACAGKQVPQMSDGMSRHSRTMAIQHSPDRDALPLQVEDLIAMVERAWPKMRSAYAMWLSENMQNKLDLVPKLQIRALRDGELCVAQRWTEVMLVVQIETIGEDAVHGRPFLTLISMLDEETMREEPERIWLAVARFYPGSLLGDCLCLEERSQNQGLQKQNTPARPRPKDALAHLG